MTLAKKTVLEFFCERDAARANALIGETPLFEACPLVLLEHGGRWFLECYDDGALAGEDVGGLLAATGLEAASIAIEAVPDADWVSETQKALPPVKAGRFTIHGSHDRSRIASQWAVEIDAGRAFGTAHHGTTRGCLLALDRLGAFQRFGPLTLSLSLWERERCCNARARDSLSDPHSLANAGILKRQARQGELARERVGVRGCAVRKEGKPFRVALRASPSSILDLGTGSGVLAIAAAKVFWHRARVAAVDLDAVAIEVARENCRKNGAAAIRLFVGDGIRPRLAYELAPFGVVLANILAKPLLRLAPRLRELTRVGGVLILSGLLSGQAREILARYRATGFCLLRRRDLEGWATLTLRRKD